MERERERGRERESVSFQKDGSVNSRPWTESARVTTPVVTAGRREKSRQYPGEGNLSRGVSASRIAVGVGRKEGRKEGIGKIVESKERRKVDDSRCFMLAPMHA